MNVRLCQPFVCTRLVSFIIKLRGAVRGSDGMVCLHSAVLRDFSYMDGIRLSVRIECLVTRCRRRIIAADRGWKATVLGVAIVIATTLVP